MAQLLRSLPNLVPSNLLDRFKSQSTGENGFNEKMPRGQNGGWFSRHSKKRLWISTLVGSSLLFGIAVIVVLALPDVNAKLAQHGLDLPTKPASPPSGLSPPPTTGSGESTMPTSDVKDALAAHNEARAKYKAPPMVWDTELEAAAKKWSDRCVFEHSKGAVGKYGENLGCGAGTGGYTYTVRDAVKAWVDEVKVVWKGSTRLGCVNVQCNLSNMPIKPAFFVVCEYAPQGNIIGHFAENVSS